VAKLLLFLIVFYKKGISVYLRPRCRYSPTCSQYAYDAIQAHGAALGSIMAAYRVFRCNPFSKGGFDPPPPKGFHKMGLW